MHRYLNGVSDGLYEGALDTGLRVSLALGACGPQEVGFFHQHSDHVDWVFVDHPSYHRAGVLLLLLKTPCMQPALALAQSSAATCRVHLCDCV